MALFQKNDFSTKIANNIWNVIVNDWMLNYSHAREHVFLTNIQDCEHSRVINWLTVPIPYKQLFNLALKVGNRLIDLTLWNSRLAYMSTADAQHVTGCLILNTKPFILPMNNFGCIYSQIHKRSLLSVLFCVRRWISLSQNLRTRKSPNPFL